MGNIASTADAVMPAVAGSRPRRAQPPAHLPDQATRRDLNEKFDAFSVADHPSQHPRVSSGDQVSASLAHKWATELLEDSKNRLAFAALSTNNPNAILESPTAVLADTQTFNIAIPHEATPITNQQSSGRCWLFAATNVFRVAIIKKYNLPAFELSQAYLFFWDKLEKANSFLENTIDTHDQPIDGRLVGALNGSPVGDGGQWDMIVNLVSKYGLVPQGLYPDSWNALNSSTMDRLLTTKLREHALNLRASLAKGVPLDVVRHQKDIMLQDVVRILTLTLGPPPARDKPFTWQFYDNDKKLQTLKMTPLEFAAGLNDNKTVRACGGTDVHALFSLVNDPRNDYYQLLTVNRLGNVWGARPVTYVNVDMQVMKEAAISMLKKGFPLFFGSDVGKFCDSNKGILDPKLIDYELGFNVKLGMTKAQRIETLESAMTHAMVLTAVHVDDATGKPVRWRIENSWGAAAGDNGYFVATDAWMDEFCYQVVVDPCVVPKKVTDVLHQKPKVLPFWDPMGRVSPTVFDHTGALLTLPTALSHEGHDLDTDSCGG